MKNDTPDYRITKTLEGRVATIAQHWALVDAKLAPTAPLQVLVEMDLAAFCGLPEQVETRRLRLRRHLLWRKLATEEFRLTKISFRKRVQWFRQYMLGSGPGPAWLAALPLLPDVGRAVDEFLDPIREMEILWEMVAALPPVPGRRGPVAPDGYGSAEFTAELAAVGALWSAVRVAELEVRLARAELLVLQRHAAAAIAAYGHSARGRLAPGDALLASIPRTWKRRVKSAGPART